MSVSPNTCSKPVDCLYFLKTDACNSSGGQTRCIDRLSISKIAYGIIACLVIVLIFSAATSLLPQSIGYGGAAICSLLGFVAASFSYQEEKVETSNHRDGIKVCGLPITGVLVDKIIDDLGDDTYTLASLSELKESPLRLSDYVDKLSRQDLIKAYNQEVVNLEDFFINGSSKKTIQPADIFGEVDNVLKYPILSLLRVPDLRTSIDGGYRHAQSSMETHFCAENSHEKAIIKAFEETDARVFRSDMYTINPTYKWATEATEGYIVFYGKVKTSQHVVPFLLFFIYVGVGWDIMYVEQDGSTLRRELQSAVERHSHITPEDLRKSKEVWSVLLHPCTESSHLSLWLAALIRGEPSPYVCFKGKDLSSFPEDIVREPIKAEFIGQATMQLCSPSEDITHSDWNLEEWNI